MHATVPPSLDIATEPRRGGFWRRWLSAIIDIVIVMLPFQILAAILFNMTAGRVQMDNGLTQGYMIDKDGKPVHGFAIDWIVWLTLLAYLGIMTWKTGRSLGDRATKLRVIDTADPGAPGVPLRKAFIRYPAMIIGLVPVFALLIWRYVAGDGSADAMFTADTFRWAMVLLSAAALWEIVLIVQVARKTDPYYDRLAGTAVVRV
jgi:hypothetical protein